MTEFLRLGDLFFRSGKNEKAVKLYRLFMRDSPEDFRAHYSLGLALSSLSPSSSSSSPISSVNKKENISESPYSRMAHQLEEAVQCFKQALVLNPELVDAHSSLAALYIRLGQPSNAVNHCRLGLKLDDTNSICVYNMNVALRQLDRLAEAVRFTRSRIPNISVAPQFSENGCCEPTSSFLHGLNQSIPSSSFNIVMLKWGDKYGIDYVVSLARAVRKQLSIELAYDIICFTDKMNEMPCQDIIFRQLPNFDSEKWKGWWYKAYLFSKESELDGPIIYLDLDTILCSSINFLAAIACNRIHARYTVEAAHNENKKRDTLSTEKDAKHLLSSPTPFFACLKASELSNEGRSCGLNSSIMLWNATSQSPEKNYFHAFYGFLRSNFQDVLKNMIKFDHFLELMLATDQGTFPGAILLQDELKGKIIDFHQAELIFEKDSCDDENNAAIICFPLHPKPHDICDKSWVQHYWAAK